MARVYVSSTFADLQDYRQAARHILQQYGHQDVAMETYGADERRPLEKCLDDVASCDVYVGILAWRYGYVPDGQPESITVLEYRQAKALDKPCLIFLLADDAPWPGNRYELDAMARVQALREEWGAEHTVAFVSNPDQLAAQVGAAITDWERRQRARTPVDLPAPGPPAAQILCTIPAVVGDFAGRTAEIDEAVEVLLGTETSLAPAIVTISGPGGVGKSQLAARIARDPRVIRHFTDGQLYLNLRGQDNQPITIDRAMRRLMRTLGITNDRFPADIEELTDLYRRQFEGKRYVVLLDNARDFKQVRTLLPAAGTCGALLTSRPPLSIAGSTTFRLQPLPSADAIQLLGSLFGQEWGDAESDDVKEVLDRCSCFPLALRLAGTLAQRRRWSLATLAAQLHEQRLTVLAESGAADDDVDASVRASFRLSYLHASEDARRLLGRLSHFELQTLGVGFAAALIETSEARARDLLYELCDEQLLEQLGEDTFGIHDLVRGFAQEQDASEGSAGKREAAVERGLVWYTATIEHTANLFDPFGRSFATFQMAEPPSDATDVDRDLERFALRWFMAEETNLLPLVRMADRLGKAGLVSMLARALPIYLDRRGLWAAEEEVCRLGLSAARALSDRLSECAILASLGTVYQQQRRWDEAIEVLRQGLAISRELASRDVEGQILNNLGGVYWKQDRRDEAIDHYEQALSIFEKLGEQQGEAQALNNLGVVHDDQGRIDEAIDLYQRALAISCQARDLHTQGHTMVNLGAAYQRQNRWDEAIDFYEQALVSFRELGDRHAEGTTLANLGMAYNGQARWGEATDVCERALAILHELGDRHGEGMVLTSLGNAHEHLGAQEDACAHYGRALAIFRELEDHHGKVYTLARLGAVHGRRGDDVRAREAYIQALELLDPASEDYEQVQQWLEDLNP